MTINYGKRNGGALTAASPGDTLYIPLEFVDLNGASVSIGSTLAVTDIELFKNGGVAQRATDSGYAILGDTGNFDNRTGFKGISIQLFNTADDASFYANGSMYWVAIDSVTVGSQTVRFFPAVFEIGEPRANIVQVAGDTGAANHLKNAFANGFNDTGVTNRFDRIQSEVDTGLRVHIDDSDTGVKDVIADLDTGLRGILQTTGVNVTSIDSDTGAADQLGKAFTTTPSYFQQVNVTQLAGDTGAAGWLKATFLQGFTDTGLNERLARIQSDVDTGLRVHIDDSDTGVKDTIADLDTGLRGILNTTGVNVASLRGDTGAANWLKTVYSAGFSDTGLYSRLDKLAEDTGGVNVNSIQGDTGAAGWLKATFLQGFADTGLNERLARIQSDVDTGLRVHIDDSDTGLKDVIADLDTGLRDYIDNTDTGLRARINTLAEDTGGVNINSIQGDTGAAGWLRAAFANGFADTGLYSRIDKLAEDTGGVNINSIQGDTGAAGWLKATFASGFTDTGLNERLGRIQSDVDTGLRVHIDDLDTGIKNRFDDLAEDTGGVNISAIAGDTGAASRLQQFAGTKLSSAGMLDTGTLAGTQAGTLDSNVTHVNETAVQGVGTSASPWRPT